MQDTDKRLDDARGIVAFGLLVSALFIGGFTLWSYTAPLDSAAIAPGTVKVETNQLVIDHAHGGTISTLPVQDGDTVEAGDILLTLQTTDVSAQLKVLRGQRLALLVTKARLLALQADEPKLRMGTVLSRIAETETAAREAIETQKQLLRAERKANLAGRRANQERLNQLAERIAGAELQIDAFEVNLAATENELDDAQGLLNSGLTTKTRVLALTRERVQATGQIAVLKTEISALRSAQTAIRLELEQSESVRQADIANQLQSINTELNQLTPRILATTERVRATVIRAPRSGRIFDLRKFTVGETIQPAEQIMQIVPNDVDLVVEANFKLNDRDILSQGLRAQVRFTGFGFAEQEPLDGSVERISANSVLDPATGQRSYLAIVQIPATEFEGRNIKLEAGMTADVIVPLQSRTLVEYLLEPLTRNWSLAFRES